MLTYKKCVVKSKYNTEKKKKSTQSVRSAHSQSTRSAFWGDPVRDVLLVYSNIQITK